jgi:response regulator of citrate/malate metabolism
MNVQLASDCDEAVRAIRDNFPHIVLLDLYLEKEIGLVMFKELRKYPPIPVIMVSANKKMSLVKKSIVLGAVDYMVKPIKQTILLQKIKKNISDDSIFEVDMTDFKDEQKVAKLAVTGSLKGVGETTCMIQSAFKMNSDDHIKIVSELFKREDIEFSSLVCKDHMLGTDSYLFNTIFSYRGISEANAKKLRVLRNRMGRAK